MRNTLFLAPLVGLALAYPQPQPQALVPSVFQPRSVDLFNATSASGNFVHLLESLASLTESAIKNLVTKPFSVPAKFQGWKTYKANGVNLGGWLTLEKGLDPAFFNNNCASAAIDEDSFCQVLGKFRCGLLLEQRYRTYFTTQDIDKFASFDVNTLRIPVGYWAFMPSSPGNHYYTGGQLLALTKIAQYAILRYNMHIIVDLHGLPGGQNAFDNQGKTGQLDWWHNSTNMALTLQLVDKATDFILLQPNSKSFTLSIINEPLPAPYFFGQTNESIAYLNEYYNASLTRVRKKSAFLPVMLSDGFIGPQTWDPYWANSTQNIVFDTHIYFFTSGAYSYDAAYGACYLAKSYQVATNPVFIGEWSIQATAFNHLGDNTRKDFFQSQFSAYQTFLNGGSFWNGKHNGTEVVGTDGSMQPYYWSWEVLASEGIVPRPGATLQTYC